MFGIRDDEWGHTRWAVGLAIGLMACTVVLVLDGLGIFVPLDAMLNKRVVAIGLSGSPRVLPDWGHWGWIGLLAFGLPQAILHVTRRWQRLMLMIGALVLTLLWIPVLALASIEVSLGAVIVVWLWASLGSLIVTGKYDEN